MSVGPWRPVWCKKCNGKGGDCALCKSSGRIRPHKPCAGQGCGRCQAGFVPAKALTERYWRPEQEEEFREHYGVTSAERLGRRLGQRSKNALKIRARREYGMNQYTMQGMYSARQIARAMGVEEKTVTWWCNELGLEYRNGPNAGPNRAHMIYPEWLEAFFRKRPECYDPDRVSPAICQKLGLSLNVPPPKPFKLVVCQHGNEHATLMPIHFWAPILSFPSCPACGRKVSNLAVGNPRGRYTDKPLQPPVLETLSLVRLRILQALADGLETRFELAGAIYGDWTPSSKEVIKHALLRLEAQGLMTVQRRVFKGTERGAPRIFYALSDEGRAIVARMRQAA